MTSSMNSKVRSALKVIGINVAVLGVLLVGMEGLASFALFARDVMKTSGLAERWHAKYDPDLGWVNEPRVYLPDLYGPGVGFRTNAQGFRNDRDVDAAVPAGKFRVICSGDSFTLGYGVDNDHAWCHLLSVLDPRIEAVNMGQGGYGVDQAYLWYKRDGANLASNLHLLAFVTEDFRRMQLPKFLGFGKPMLVLEHDSLVVKNVPVPTRAYNLSWLVSNVGNVRRLRTAELATRLAAKTRASSSSDSSAQQADARTKAVLGVIFAALKRHHEIRGGKLALVYLPTLPELTGSPPQGWIDFVEQAARELDIPFINVVTAFRDLPDGNLAGLFIPPGALVYPYAAGHLNNRGNELVARAIFAEMKRQPGFAP